MLRTLFSNRMVRFLLGGGAAAAFNLLLMVVIVNLFKFDTPFLRNVANIVSVELSLLLSFFIYRTWVWPGGIWNIREVLWQQLPLYHLSAGSAVVLRVLFLFPVLDWMGVDYLVNTLTGILLSAYINYVISDSLVFKTKVAPPTELHVPEGLAPALLRKSNLQKYVPHSKYVGQEARDRSLTLSVVIPAHNEEGAIEQTVQAISQALDEQQIDYEILIINDNSRDRTEVLLQQISTKNCKVRYINNYYPNGFGFAVRCGLENYKGDAAAIVMADGSDDPEDLANYYYKLLEGYDCVFGSRFIREGKVIDYPIHKLVLNRLANMFIQLLFGLKFNDITNAFKIYRREVIVGISPLISHHFNLTVEMPLKAIARGYSYATIPIAWKNRKTGISKLKIKEMGSRYLFIVLYIFLEKNLARGDYLRKDPQRQATRGSTQ